MNKHIDSIIKSINRHKKGLRDPQIMHPEREWLIGIFLALLIFVSATAWSLAVYLTNRNAAAVMPTEEQSESVVYRESMVEEALLRLEKRGTMLASLLPRTTESESVETPLEETASTTEEIAPVVEETLEEVEDVDEVVEEVLRFE